MSASSAWSGIAATIAALLLLTSLPAQTEPRSAAEQKRGSRDPATHAPEPDLPPAMVLAHLRAGNLAAVEARKLGKPAPRPRPRPAGAGRYVCAVLVCADADVDVAALLGLARRDVLVISVPGPFVSSDSVALLEHHVAEERLPLALVLTHGRCTTSSLRGKTAPQTAMQQRIALARQLAKRHGHSLPKALARRQRELLLSSSDLLRVRCGEDRLRVLPAEVDGQSLQIRWHTTRAQELAMPPVK